MIEHYKHTQVGYLIISVMCAVIVLIGVILAITGVNWIIIGTLVVIIGVLALFSSLTVVIEEAGLEVRLGPGLIRKRFELSEIESCQAVKLPWYYGWGIRLTSHGLLYRVSGFNAVRIKLRTGREYLIGTDVPQELEEAIRQAITF